MAAIMVGFGRAGKVQMARGPMPKMPALTGLRFFAALWVVVAHGRGWWRPGLLGASALNTFFAHGTYAVILFFVLSGFVLSYSYIGSAREFRGSWVSFYLARFARIYPMYLWACILGVGPFLRWHGDLPLGQCDLGVSPVTEIASTVVLVQQWLPGNAICLNNPAWSLSCEMFFYALFPLIAVVLAALSARGALLSGALVWLAVVTFGAPTIGAPVSFLPVFVIGACAGRVHAHIGVPRTSPRWAWACAGLLAALTICVPLIDPARNYMLLVPLIALLLYALAQGGGVIAAALSCQMLIALGEASYTLYIIHWPLLEWITHLTGRVFGTPATADPLAWPLFVVYLTLLIALSLILHRVLEQPAQRAIRRLARRDHKCIAGERRDATRMTALATLGSGHAHGEEC